MSSNMKSNNWLELIAFLTKNGRWRGETERGVYNPDLDISIHPKEMTKRKLSTWEAVYVLAGNDILIYTVREIVPGDPGGWINPLEAPNYVKDFLCFTPDRISESGFPILPVRLSDLRKRQDLRVSGASIFFDCVQTFLEPAILISAYTDDPDDAHPSKVMGYPIYHRVLISEAKKVKKVANRISGVRER